MSDFKFIGLHSEEYTVSEMCRVLSVTRQGYEKHKKSLIKPPRHAALLAEIQAIIEEDEYNDKYGRERIHDALILRGYNVSLSTVYRVCRDHGICQAPNRPKGLTKTEKEAYKSDDLLKGDFDAQAPCDTITVFNDGQFFLSPRVNRARTRSVFKKSCPQI